MAFTQIDIDAVDRAISQGERIVKFADRTVEYRSIDELTQARNLMLREIGATSGRKQSRITRLYHAGKGF